DHPLEPLFHGSDRGLNPLGTPLRKAEKSGTYDEGRESGLLRLFGTSETDRKLPPRPRPPAASAYARRATGEAGSRGSPQASRRRLIVLEHCVDERHRPLELEEAATKDSASWN